MHADYDAVVFDFYGTLVDGGSFSFDVATDAILGELEDGGISVARGDFQRAYRAEVEHFFATRVPEGIEEHNTLWLARALTKLGEPVEAEDPRVVRAVDSYFARYEEEIVPLPGAGEVLRGLAERFRLGLLSNFTDARPVRGVIEREGFAEYLDAVVISAELGLRKPHADVFREALRQLDVRPQRTLFVGDDPRDDIQGASALGMKTVWVRSGMRPHLVRWVGGEVIADSCAADYTVDGVGQLLELLARD